MSEGPAEWLKGLDAFDLRWFWHVGPPVVKRCIEQAWKQEAEAAKRKTIEIDSRFSPAELVVIDEASRITPFEWEGLAKATEALRPKPSQPAKKRPPLHKPQPWNPPVAKRRKR